MDDLDETDNYDELDNSDELIKYWKMYYIQQTINVLTDFIKEKSWIFVTS
jgi:hypothetical protein